jgi:hypothetical protein
MGVNVSIFLFLRFSHELFIFLDSVVYPCGDSLRFFLAEANRYRGGRGGVPVERRTK